MVEFDKFDHFAIARAEGEGMIKQDSIVINSPIQSVRVDTQPNQAPAHEPVSEVSAPANFEVPNEKISEINITPINLK